MIETLRPSADHQAELNFVVQGGAVGADDGAGFGGEDGRWGFEKEERLGGAGRREFSYMVAGDWGGSISTP